MTGIILWLAIGAAYVLFLEWRIERAGGREHIEARAGWRVTPQFRAYQRCMVALTWPYWVWSELIHIGRLLLMLLGLRK